MKKIIFLLTALPFCANAAELEKVAKTEPKIYHGDIFLYPYRPILYGTGKHYQGEKLKEAGFKLAPDELLYEIWACNDECSNWHRDKKKPYKIFPSHLPMSILKDLEEGDEIGLKLKNGFKCVVKASQIGSRYEENKKSFQAMRNELLQVFLNRPDYQDDEKELEKMNLIQKGMVEPSSIAKTFEKKDKVEGWTLTDTVKLKYLTMLQAQKNNKN